MALNLSPFSFIPYPGERAKVCSEGVSSFLVKFMVLGQVEKVLALRAFFFWLMVEQSHPVCPQGPWHFQDAVKLSQAKSSK